MNRQRPSASEPAPLVDQEPHDGLWGRLFKNALTNWAAFAVDAVTAVVLTPILIHGLGDFYYGMYYLVFSLVGYYGLLDVGLRNTLQRFVARYEGAAERQAQDETFVTALVFGSVVSLLLCLFTLAIAPVLPGILKIAPESQTVFRQLVYLLGFTVAVSFVGRLIGAYLLGLQRFELYNLVIIVTSLARLGVFITLLRRGYGVLSIALASFVLAAFSLALFLKLVRVADPRLILRWGNARRSRLRELAGFSFYVFLSKVGDQFRFQMDSVVISRWLGVAFVTPFSVANRLMSLFRGVLLGVLTPLTPAMSRMEGGAQTEQLHRLFLRATRVSALIALGIGLLLILNGRAILRLWVGEALVSSYPLLAILTLAYIPDFAQAPSSQLLYAKGKPEAIGWLTLLEGLANLGLSIYWVTRYQLIGVALGTLAPMLVNKIFLQNIVALRAAGLSAATYFRESFVRPLLVAAVFLLLCWLAGVPGANPAGLVDFLLHISWQTALFCSLAGALGLTSQERQALRRWIRSGTSSIGRSN